MAGFVVTPRVDVFRPRGSVRAGVARRRSPWVCRAEEGSGQRSTLRFYNSLSRTKEEFVPLEPGVVKFYSCGPTVYDFAHIGNFRAFLTYDVIKRWLLYQGYDVKHIVNLTDVEDKIIRKVREQNIDLKSLTEHFTAEFFADMKTLNIIPAEVYPKATEHIPEIVHMVEVLKERGFAYENDGSVYFSVNDFPEYGRLARLEKRTGSLDKAQREGLDVEDADEYDKNDARDFVLWKNYKEEDGEVYWDTKLGRGRPGWHIECSCMARKYLGDQLDIHSGGIDLEFPHHENEIAQSEAFSGYSPFSKFWMHNGFVNIDGEKMSKSKGNFWTLRDIVKTPDDARAFRFFIVTSQYRNNLNMSQEVLQAAKSSLKRIDRLVGNLTDAENSSKFESESAEKDLEATLNELKSEFERNMDDDLNTPRAIATVFKLVGIAEGLLKKDAMSSGMATSVKKSLTNFDQVFGIFYEPDVDVAEPETSNLSGELEELLTQRANARQSKDWARADEIRDLIAAAGFVVEDTANGPNLIPK